MTKRLSVANLIKEDAPQELVRWALYGFGNDVYQGFPNTAKFIEKMKKELPRHANEYTRWLQELGFIEKRRGGECFMVKAHGENDYYLCMVASFKDHCSVLVNIDPATDRQGFAITWIVGEVNTESIKEALSFPAVVYPVGRLKEVLAEEEMPVFNWTCHVCGSVHLSTENQHCPCSFMEAE